MIEKPPLGVMPREIWERARVRDLLEAMQRYNDSGKVIPIKWVDELKELSERLSIKKGGDA